jgi:2-C-methyl-D-erythritol 4-phosphate cytidylyltransferase
MKNSINMSINNPHYYCVIPAAGCGARMQTTQPKQYLQLTDVTVLEHALRPFLALALIKKVIVVVAEGDQTWPRLAISQHPKIVTVKGASERAMSVYNGLKKLSADAQAHDWVMIHDAVRPCITVDAINRLITELADEPVGGLLGFPVRDTLKLVTHQSQQVEQTVPRANIWTAQTPQMFRFGLLMDAYAQFQTLSDSERSALTDDSSIVERTGLTPKMVLSTAENIKITYSADLASARAHIRSTAIPEEI